jgi:hypothetical protein
LIAKARAVQALAMVGAVVWARAQTAVIAGPPRFALANVLVRINTFAMSRAVVRANP